MLIHWAYIFGMVYVLRVSLITPPPHIYGGRCPKNTTGTYQLVAASKGVTEATLELLYFADIPARWSDPSDTLASGHHCWFSSFLI